VPIRYSQLLPNCYQGDETWVLRHLLIFKMDRYNDVCFSSHHDPDPVMASRKQDEKRRYRLEFQIRTFVYATE
jgi:hypothetical protein